MATTAGAASFPSRTADHDGRRDHEQAAAGSIGTRAARPATDGHDHRGRTRRPPEDGSQPALEEAQEKGTDGFFGKFQAGFEHRFEKLREGYHSASTRALHHHWLFAIIFLALCLGQPAARAVSGAAISSRPWMPASSSSTSAPRPGRASRRPRGSATRSRRRSAASSRRRISTASSTTSGCPIRASISPTRTRA